MHWVRDIANLLLSVAREHGTPFYVFSAAEFNRNAQLLPDRIGHTRHSLLLSFKTCPIRDLVRLWTDSGRRVEVISEFELRACLGEGVAPEKIVVNGVGKTSWLPRIMVSGLLINIDSESEAERLLDCACKRGWAVGVRFHPTNEIDPDNRADRSQFGLDASRFVRTVANIRKAGLEPTCVHFHLRSNIYSFGEYVAAGAELSRACTAADLRPRFLDIGGGLPCPTTWPSELLTPPTWTLSEYVSAIEKVTKGIEPTEELWTENGRFISGSAGALLCTVVDRKTIGDEEFLILDGGRTNQALVSDWEYHHLTALTPQVSPTAGPSRTFTVCGPTCMAYDRLGKVQLPDSTNVGDVICWHDAGAYHLPWENHFSRGRAAVYWVDNGQIHRIRKAETFDEWWSQWI